MSLAERKRRELAKKKEVMDSDYAKIRAVMLRCGTVTDVAAPVRLKVRASECLGGKKTAACHSDYTF